MSDKVIEALNKALASELTAIHQYMSQHFQLEDAGFVVLADKIKDIGKAEMHHAEALSLRILILGGVPVSTLDGPVALSEPIPALLKTDIALETKAIAADETYAALCLAENDQASRDLMARILAEEEQHRKDFETIAGFVDKLGAPYLATLVGVQA